jgi:hypothetical protein
MADYTIEGGNADEREAIQELYDHHGHLTAVIVLEAAEPPEHPLHDRFTWDDTDAAHKYRLQQAGQVIRGFKIRRPTADGRVIKVDRFTRTDNGTYLRTEDVVTVENLRDQRRMRLLVGMERLRKELSDFEEFAELITAIDAVLRT